MKEIYNSQHIYTLMEKSFCPDIEKVKKNNHILESIFLIMSS
jgi:hypothetical protein